VSLQGDEARNHCKDGFRFTARFCGAATSLIDGSYDMPERVRVD
jgi:hypothetical protein